MYLLYLELICGCLEIMEGINPVCELDRTAKCNSLVSIIIAIEERQWFVLNWSRLMKVMFAGVISLYIFLSCLFILW